MRTPSPSKSPSRAGSARWPRDPSYLTDSWAPGTPRTSPFRESDPAHFWKPFGTNKVGYEELDAAVFSDRLDILKGPELPTTPRSRFREREAVAEKHRVRYRTLSAADEARHGHSERVAADPPGLDDAEAETQATAAVRSSREAVPDGDDAFQQQTVQPYKVSVFLKLGGTQPAPQVVQKTRGYGDQFYSNIVTSKVSHDGIPSRPAPAVPAKTLDSRGVLLRRSVAAVTGSVMCDVTVDSLMNQQTGESVDPSLGVVATPRSAVVMAATDFSEKPQDGSRAPSSAAQEPAATSAAEQPEKPAVNWRRFSTDPAAQGDQEQRTPRGIHPGRPLLYTPEKFDIRSRLQMLDRGEPASAVEPPLLTTVGIWVPSVAAAKSTAAALRDAAASGALQASFQERGLESTVELLNIEHDEEPPPPPPPPEPEPEVEEDSDDESVRAAQVPKAELLYRLFSSGRGFRRLLYASFLQNSLEHVPEQRVVHVTEGPYMHSTFLLREPLWTGMSMRLALIALMHPEDRSTDSDDEAAHAQNPYDFRAPVEEEDAVWPLWILPNAAALARKGLLREALEVAERELATNVAMSSTNANHGTDPNFDVSASVFERLVVLQNIMALDLITRCPKGSDALHILLRAEVLTRSRDPAAGGSPCCSCNSAFSHARAAHSARGSAGPRCNRGLLRVATLTNLAAYYRRKGLLNAGHQYMYRAVKLSLRRRLPATGGDEWAVDDGNVSEAAVCLSVPPQCRAAARINQGALLIMMRSYEEGLKCSSAALSRLQEEWAKGRLSLRDPLQDTRNAHLARGSPNGTKSLVMRQRDARLAAGRGLRGLVSESMAMVTEIAVCMYNAGVCHEQLYRAPAALQAYLRTQAVLSLIPRQHPTAGALQQLLGPEGLLRVQMADLAQSRSARTPAGQRARPWRPSTAGTNDTASLVNAAWGDDSEMEGEWEGVPREGESAVLQDFSQFLQQDGEQGGRANGAGNVSPFKRARERNWKSSLAVVSDLEPGAGRQSDGGPDRSWPANRSGGGRVGGVFGINSSLSGSRSAARPQTATGLGQVRTISEGRAEGDVSVDSPGWNLVSPQRPRTSGGMERQSTAQDAAAPTHLAGGFRSRLRDELGASRRATAAGMLAVKYGASNDSLVDKMAPEGSAEWEHGDEGPQEEQVFWGGRSRKPTSVVPVVLRGKEADSAGRHTF
jgi:hypothetical protein